MFVRVRGYVGELLSYNPSGVETSDGQTLVDLVLYMAPNTYLHVYNANQTEVKVVDDNEV